MNLADSIREQGGPTSLDLKAIPDGAVLQRSGTSVVGTAPSALTAGSASAITTTTGPTVLTIAAIADNEILTRSGTTIDGVNAAALSVGSATSATVASTSLGLTASGPVALTVGAIADGDDLARSGTVIVGVPRNSVTAAPDATYDWNSTAMYLAVTHAAAACDVTLPDETQVTNWPVGQTRRLVKQNTSANGINLLAPANVVINGAVAGTDASPVTGSLLVPAIAVNAPFWFVYRASTTAFWIQGWAS